MRHRVLCFIFCCLVLPWLDAEAATAFFDDHTVMLVELLPAPPADDSVQTKAELADLLAIQAKRTPEQVVRVQADATEDIWRFADVVHDAKFDQRNLPKFSAFFARVVETESAVTDPAKAIWKRTRPHLLNALLKPVVKLSQSGAWPSGHATVGTMMGIVLAKMLPEKRREIIDRAAEFAQNRVLSGIHFQSDVSIGKTAGTAIAAVLFTRKDFKKEFELAKKELRNVLKLDTRSRKTHI